MLKYNKTYHYLLSFLHASGQTYYIIHKHYIGTFFTNNSDLYQVLPSRNSIETFLKKNYEKKNKIESGAFSMVGRGR